MLEELFVPIEGFPQYAVSNYGTIVNVRTNRELSPFMHPAGFLQIKLYLNGVHTKFFVHRLVAQAFFVNYSDAREVEFINRIKTDCAVVNLTISKKARGCNSEKGSDSAAVKR